MLQTDASVNALYNAHLDAAHCFYHHLLIHIKEAFCSAIKIPIDWMSEKCIVFTGNKGDLLENANKENTEWAVKSCQRCLLYLGDLGMYIICFQGC